MIDVPIETTLGMCRDCSVIAKLASCVSLLICSVAATICAENSKSPDGSYPYNSFMIPCTVEALKLLVSGLCLLLTRTERSDQKKYARQFSLQDFAKYALPAAFYFTSNNCMFFIIKELGPTMFQLTNNLKVLSTAFLMKFLIGRNLTWLQWKALSLLVIGTAVAQIKCGDDSTRGSSLGYFLVLVNVIAAGGGGVVSEKLLKGSELRPPESIHWQNMQLYFFGLFFGLVSLIFDGSEKFSSFPLQGFNLSAYGTVLSMTASGLLVSFILKYLDNFAKCFVAAFTIIFVAVIHSAMKQEQIPLTVTLGIVLTCMALEQYNIPNVSPAAISSAT